ncbi:hypothetical protein NDU88_002278 [Pleurodeles waltl]|uniref:Uncharacterized protein n=1 Tax=Pleurodeles waltl TaxID=8319 RepID=A0AAV7LC40_PLEWA|nr:hypothetical protein NDU88_002278 [Pleurodeles waltl]
MQGCYSLADGGRGHNSELSESWSPHRPRPISAVFSAACKSLNGLQRVTGSGVGARSEVLPVPCQFLVAHKALTSPQRPVVSEWSVEGEWSLPKTLAGDTPCPCHRCHPSP